MTTAKTINPVAIGCNVYCVIDGDIQKRKCVGYSNNGFDFLIDTIDGSFILGEEAFNTKKEASAEIRSWLKDC